MRYLRTNTAARVTVGPFLDKTDGVTPKTALTVTGIKLTLVVDDANVPTLVLDTNPTASGGNNDMVHITGDDAGFYDLELTAANTNYLGRAMLALTDAANHCPVFHEFMILPAMIYDSLVLGSDRLDTNVTHVGDTAQTAGDIFSRLPALVSGRIDASVGALQSGGTTAVENAVWDAVRSSHVAAGSMGLCQQTILRDFTAAAGAAGSITFDASAPTTVDFYKSAVVYIYAGTGANQAPRTITAYSSGRVASIVPNWTTTPDNTSKCIVWSLADAPLVGSDSKILLSGDSQTGVTIPTVTTLTNAPSDSSGVTAIKAITDNIAYKKNTALNNFEFIMTDSTTHAVKTGISSFTAKVSIDGGAQSDLTNAPSEVGNGIYKVNLTSGEMNGKVITLRFSATAADDTIITLHTNG